MNWLRKQASSTILFNLGTQENPENAPMLYTLNSLSCPKLKRCVRFMQGISCYFSNINYVAAIRPIGLNYNFKDAETCLLPWPENKAPASSWCLTSSFSPPVKHNSGIFASVVPLRVKECLSFFSIFKIPCFNKEKQDNNNNKKNTKAYKSTTKTRKMIIYLFQLKKNLFLSDILPLPPPFLFFKETRYFCLTGYS